MAPAITKFQGLTTQVQIDEAIESLTDPEWDLLEQVYLGVIHQLILDYLVEPLGMTTPPIDGSELFCQLYARSLARTAEA